MSVPQTIDFTLKLRFDHIEREGNRVETVEHLTFEEMLERYRKERRRRKRGDRCTSATYTQVLTDHGRAMLDSNDDHYTRERYKDALSGTEFPLA